MLTQHIALVPEVAGVNLSELARVCAALQRQVVEHLAPIWHVSATVTSFPQLEDVPVGYWPIVVTFGELGGIEGIHADDRGQPYAIIEMSPSWSVAASHVCLEMLVDPFGRRKVIGASPRSDQGTVEFLVEICHPCEDARYGYMVSDVLVSDFCTPAYWGQIASGSERYSFSGAVQAPCQVLPGGRLNWFDPATGKSWQRDHDGNRTRDTMLDPLDPIDHRTGRAHGIVKVSASTPRLAATKMSLEAYEERMGIPRQRALRASQSQAHLLRSRLGGLASDRTRRVGALPAAERSSPSKYSQLFEAVAADATRTTDSMASLRGDSGFQSELPRDEMASGLHDRSAASDVERVDPYLPFSERAAFVERPSPHAQRAQVAHAERRTVLPTLPRSSPVARTTPSATAERLDGGRVVSPSFAPTSAPADEREPHSTRHHRDPLLWVAVAAAAGLVVLALSGIVSPRVTAVGAAAPVGAAASLVSEAGAPAAQPTSRATEGATQNAKTAEQTGTSRPEAAAPEAIGGTSRGDVHRPLRTKTARPKARVASSGAGSDPSDDESFDLLVDERR
jgi:hypothetical protein